MTTLYIITNGHDIGGVFSRAEYAASAAQALGDDYHVVERELDTAAGLQAYAVLVSKKYGTAAMVHKTGDLNLLAPVQETTGSTRYIVFAESEDAAIEQALALAA